MVVTKVTTTLRLSPKTHRLIKAIAVAKKVEMSEIVEDAISSYIKHLAETDEEIAKIVRQIEGEEGV